jgi:ribose transport system substrate-binding protein
MKTKIALAQVISALLGAMLIASAHADEGLSIPNALPAPNEITTKGPDGEVATWYTELQLTPEELQKVKEKNARICYETVTDSEWDQANLRGFKAAAESLNMKIVAIANAQLNPTNQKNNMENFVALKPDVINTQPHALKIAAKTFDPLVAQGIKFVFLSNVPEGYTPGKQYVSALTDSLYDMGKDAAVALAKAIGEKGEILSIEVAGVNYVTNTRDGAFRDTIKQKYPNIKIDTVGGFQTPDQAGQVTTGLLTRFPNVKGIYVSFSTPADSVLEGLRSLGRRDVKIVTDDLDSVCALDMARNGNVAAIVEDLAYQMGYGRALLSAYGVINKAAPKYVASPSFTVTRGNLVDGWKLSFGVVPPPDIMKALGK